MTSRTLINKFKKWYARVPLYEEKEVGAFKIERELKDQLPLISMRQAVLEGLPPIQLKFPVEPYPLFTLTEDGEGTWMSTMPQEVLQQGIVAEQARGNVLVGGLGLGLVAHFLSFNEKVTNVTVVEVNQGLIDFIRPYIDSRVQIVHENLYDFIKTMSKYDFAYFDIWQTTGEYTWQRQVVPLRRICYRKIRRIVCWQESEMQGQIHMGAYRYINIEPEHLGGPGRRHWYAWRMGNMDIRPPQQWPASFDTIDDIKRSVELEGEARNDPRIAARLDLFVNQIGSPEWEDRYGIHWKELRDEDEDELPRT